MIKELFLAIILGAILGFGLTGGFLALNKNKLNTSASTIKKETVLTPTPEISQSPTPTIVQKSDGSLTINSPENESVVNVSKTTIKGSAPSNNIIIIQTPTKIYNSTADNSGNFSVDIALESGVNSIKITSIDSQTNETSESDLLVTYSTAKL
jgi:hypothetical protein